MDEKKAREILDKEIARLKDAALTSSNTCMTSLVLAITDKAVQDLFVQKLKDDNVFKGIRCLSGLGIPEYRRVEFHFECKEGAFCLVPTSFLVIVDIVSKTVFKIVDPYLGIDPGFGHAESMTISGSGYIGWGRPSAMSDGDVGWFKQKAMGDGDIGWSRQVQHMGDGDFGWFNQTGSMGDGNWDWTRQPQHFSSGYFPWHLQHTRMYDQFFPWRTPAPLMGDGMMGWGHTAQQSPISPEHFVDVRNIQVQQTAPGQATLFAEIRVPNGCYHMGQAIMQAPADTLLTPEQIGATLPVLFTGEPICTKNIQTFKYQLPFAYTSGQTSINVFVTLNGKVLGQKTLILSQSQVFSSIPVLK